MIRQVRSSLFEREWDVRVSSPRKLFRTLHDLLDRYGYSHKYEPLRPQPGGMDGTALFDATLSGEKMHGHKVLRHYALIIGIVAILVGLGGIALIASVVPAALNEGMSAFDWQLWLGISLAVIGLVVGVDALRNRSYVEWIRQIVSIRIEGESFRATGHSTDGRADVLDLVSDCRISLRGEKQIWAGREYENRREAPLTDVIDTLEGEIRQLLPRIALPEVENHPNSGAL